MLAQGRYWKAALARSADAVVVSTLKQVPNESLRGLELSVPLARWCELVKLLRGDRKLVGGLLLRSVRDEDAGRQLTEAIASDRLFGELQRVLVDATLALAEEGRIVLTPAEEPQEEA